MYYFRHKNYFNGFFFSNNILNTSIYSYEIGGTNELELKNNNLTFIMISQRQKKELLKKFGINGNESLYIFMYDTLSNDSRTATSDYDYSLILGNGIKLNISEIEDDFYVSVYVPIRNLELANFNFAEKFSQNEYDIYNIYSDFYNDICTPASINDNDITLKDRKEDIYPINVTLCKENCEYKAVDITNKKIICECNLNLKDDKIDDESPKDNDSNFINYFLDNINFNLFKCYHLFFSIDNLILNLCFYILLIAFTIIIFFLLKFIICGISNLRIIIHNKIPTEIKIKKILINYKRKNNDKYSFLRKKDFKTNTLILNKTNKKSRNRKNRKENDSSEIRIIKKRGKTQIQKSEFRVLKDKKYNNTLIKDKKKENYLKSIYKENIIKEEDIDSYNLSPYTKALREDNRNIFQIIKSFIFKKIELLNLICKSNIFKDIKICQYTLSLLIDFFFNTLLYSDEVVSHKYHNNGKLDFVVTLLISLSSNIIASIIIYCLEFSEKLEKRLDQLLEIKNEYQYLYTFRLFLKYIKLGMTIFIISQLSIILICFYFINIFFIVYNKSQKSLLFNYLTSLIEGFIKSIIIIILIVITRKMGIYYRNKYMYNISIYIDKNF